MIEAAVIVIAKAPAAGRSKTRLCPPCSPAQAASLAEAALADTLAAVAGSGAGRRVVALEGAPSDWLRPGFELIAQRGDGLAARIGQAFDDVGGPALLIGMDTPQLTSGQIEAALETLLADSVDAVLGAAPDGGYWTIGLKRANARVFENVPMSSAHTVHAQRLRLRSLSLRFRELPPLQDVDTFADALAVADAAPTTRFAARLAELREVLPVGA